MAAASPPRPWAEAPFSVPIDLGGAWIHGVKTNPLTPVILGMGFATQRTEVDPSDHLFLNHAFAKDGDRKKFSAAYEAFEEALEAAYTKSGDVGIAQVDKPTVNAADFLKVKEVQKLDKVSRRLLELNAGPLEGATELVNSSIEDANDFISADDDFLQEGYGTFVEAYGADVLPLVHLGAPVTKITRRAGGVVVEAGQGETFEARKVLVTVSTGVLAQNKIKFEPDLPESKKAAIKSLPMGVMDKVILELTTPDVFPVHGAHTLKNTWVLYGGDDPSGKEDLAFVFRPMDTNIAVGFFGGQRARDLEAEKDHGKATMVAIALKAMNDRCKAGKPKQDAAKCDAKAALKKAETTAWASTEWTLGSYSAALPGAAKMREELSKPIDSAVYFAGEGCYNSTYNGSFAGAYSSALRSSAAMIDCISREKRGEACVWHPLVAQAQ